MSTSGVARLLRARFASMRRLRRPCAVSLGLLATMPLAVGVGACGSGRSAAESNATRTFESPVDTLVGGMAAYLDGLVAERRRWDGQRVPWPAASTRPPIRAAADAERWGARVHAPEGTSAESLTRWWARALDDAMDTLSRDGWPLPPPDGGRGGTDGLDVYLIDEVESPREDVELDPELGDATRAPRRSEVRLDVPRWPEAHDAAIVHVVVAPDVPLDRIASCALQVVAEAGLFAEDPAEAASLRHATGAWLAWTYTGHAGCDEDALVRQQRASFRALLSNEPRDGEGAAILLSALADRHDAGRTGFLRDAWLAARQRTWDGGDLRGEPDLVRVLMQAATIAHDPLDRLIESLAVARYFAGSRTLADGTPVSTQPDVSLLRALGADAMVPVMGRARWDQLPRRLQYDGPAVEPWGSAYAVVDVRGAPHGSQLRVWLDGEAGTEWSLVAARLDREGRERGRTRAPPTRTARAFIPVELSTDVAEVVLVVTNVPNDRDPRDVHVPLSHDARVVGRTTRNGPDPDAPGPSGRAFRLTLDRGP